MTNIEKKTGMTDAECGYWDNYYTTNAFEPGPNLLKQGVRPGFARNTLLLSDLDPEVAEYLRTQMEVSHKSQAEVINDIVHEKISVSA
jgi:hypothetical protein